MLTEIVVAGGERGAARINDVRARLASSLSPHRKIFVLPLACKSSCLALCVSESGYDAISEVN